MTAWLDHFSAWFVEYYLLSGAYLLVLAAAMFFVKQPARRGAFRRWRLQSTPANHKITRVRTA